LVPRCGLGGDRFVEDAGYEIPLDILDFGIGILELKPISYLLAAISLLLKVKSQ
jgi:hypothetical protein